MINDKEELVNILEANIKKLISLLEKEKEAGVVLKKINFELSERLNQNEEEYKKLEARFNNLKLAKTLSSKAEDGQQAKLKINSLVREIDKCIALLNQ
jgi:septation ring formation regulator EzrA